MNMQPTDMDLTSLFNKGVKEQNTGNLDNALQIYEKIIKLQPKHCEAVHNKACVLTSQNELIEALKTFKDALNLNPNVSLYWINYIKTLVKLDRISEAKALIVASKDSNLFCKDMEALSLKIEKEHGEPSPQTVSEIDELINQKKNFLVEEQSKKERKGNQFPLDNGSCITPDADKISKRGDLYDQLQFDCRTLLVPKSFYSNYLNLGAPEVTVFCAVWSKDKNKDLLLRSHSLNLRNQTRSIFPLYIFDDGDVPEYFEMPHVVCLDPLTIYEAWNLAVKLAPTEYVLNLNLDDRLFSNSVALMQDFLEASESDLVGGEWLIDFASPRHYVDDMRVDVSQTTFLPDWPPREAKNLRLGSGTNERGTFGPSTIWKKSTTGSGYPHLFSNGEQIRSIGDALFWHSLKQAGRKLKKMPLLVGTYHSDASNQAEFRSHHDHEYVKGGWLWEA